MVVGLSLQDCLSREERDLKRILLVYLSVSATGWLVTFCYQFIPRCLSGSRGLPALFRLCRLSSSTDRPFPHEAGRAEGFPPLHYLVPGLLALAMLVWSCFVPFDVRLEIVRGKAEVIPAGTSGIPAFLPSSPC